MKTAIYLRQSADRVGNELAISRQRQDCANLCARKRWTDTIEYADNDISATNGKPRPAYSDMLADIEAGGIGAVVVWRLDRLHRQPRELEHFIDLADRHRVQLATVTGDVDLSTENGRLIARITGAVDRAEMEKKSARHKAANKQRANAGKAWNARSFGYDGNEVVADEAETIRRGCAALLNGASLWSIGKQWNAAEIRSVKGNPWSGPTVKQVLSRASNAGLQTYDGQILEGVETAWPAIISRDTYDAVCAVLGDPKRLTGKRRSRIHLLSGLARCGQCGQKMTTSVKTKGGTHRAVYVCKNCFGITRDAAKTEKVVVDIVTSRLARPDAAEIFAKPTADTKALNAQANTYRELIAAAEAEYDEGIIDGRRLQARKDTIAPKLDTVEAKLLGANTSRKLDGLLGNPKAAEVFTTLGLDRRRAVVDCVCVVTIERNERPGSRFEPERIRIDWR